MTPKEYEDYVFELVRQLDFANDGVILRNHRFDGIRQPGKYEIDIAILVKLSKVIDFLFIIECKNWKRPVDRPIIQKLAQTRDAIAAHKAAVASPVGFTSEALRVARSHGIAVWVMAQGEWTIMSGIEGVSDSRLRPVRTRRELLKQLGFWRDREVSSHARLVDATYAEPVDQPRTPWARFSIGCISGSSAPPGYDCEIGVDPRTAVSQVVKECMTLLGWQHHWPEVI